MSDENELIKDLGPSPLSEADPQSLNEFLSTRIDDLFNKPPLMLTDGDLDGIVAYYRAGRQRFAQESKTAAPTRPRRKTPTSVAEALDPSALDMI